MTKLLPLKKLVALLFTIICFHDLQAQDKASTLHHLNTLLINTVMVDGFTAPAASRVYSYPNIAFYECIRQDDASLPTLVGKLNGLTAIPQVAPGTNADHFISACIAYSYVAQSLARSGQPLEDWRQQFMDSLLLKARGDAALIRNSLLYGKLVADSVLAWAQRDHYDKLRSLPAPAFSQEPGSWQPAANAQAMEPNWKNIRPFLLSASGQFSPKEKLVYSAEKNTTFYKTMMELYNSRPDNTQKAIAQYWDDNTAPKTGLLSPGGHWLMITGQACEKKNETVGRSALAYSLTAIAISDAFIAAWDEKFRSSLARPVTVIHDLVDKKWQPYIQTPSSPVFTSGHAVIAHSAAVVLTALFGNDYAFTDKAAMALGKEARAFTSFSDASNECAISRVYAGVQYPESVRISSIQGKEIGTYVIQKLYPGAKQ